jgi:hypothetical protein
MSRSMEVSVRPITVTEEPNCTLLGKRGPYKKQIAA